MRKSIADIRPLWEALSRQTIPQARKSGITLLLAQPDFEQMSPVVAQLPDAISAKPVQQRGERIVAGYSTGVQIAHWPDDHLEATRFPVLCYVLSGRAVFQIADYELVCPAGTFVFVPPKVPRTDGSIPHIATTHEDDFCDLMWFYRWEAGILFHICHSRGVRHWNDRVAENCFVTGAESILYFDLLTQEMLSSSEQSEAIARNLLPALLAVLQRDLANNRFIQYTLPTGGEEPNRIPGEDPILYAQNYMRRRLDKPLTIDQVAEMAFMSRSRFTRQFRLATGKTFTEYLTELRLKQAKNLLKNTDWSVELIGLHVGLKPAHFWSLFRRYTGVTPSEYRRQSSGS